MESLHLSLSGTKVYHFRILVFKEIVSFSNDLSWTAPNVIKMCANRIKWVRFSTNYSLRFLIHLLSFKLFQVLSIFHFSLLDGLFLQIITFLLT